MTIPRRSIRTLVGFLVILITVVVALIAISNNKAEAHGFHHVVSMCTDYEYMYTDWRGQQIWTCIYRGKRVIHAFW